MKAPLYVKLKSDAVLKDPILGEDIYLYGGDELLLIVGPFRTFDFDVVFRSFLAMKEDGKIVLLEFHPDVLFSSFLKEHVVPNTL